MHSQSKLFKEIIDLFEDSDACEVQRRLSRVSRRATSDPSHLVCDEFATPETDVPIRGGERGQVKRVKTLG